MKKYLITVVAVLLISGCGSSGNEKVRTETMDTVSSKVTKGVTTKDQVKGLYGEPSSVTLTDGGNEVWKYEYAHATSQPQNFIPVVNLVARGYDVDKNEVVFIFDSKNIVQNYTVHASKSETKGGIATGGDVNTK